MALISYAQNFEDIMLWRALGHLDGGTYVDVGAQHPILDSVSRCFYENGWRGIHVEPTPMYAEMLRIARPDETVIQAAVGREAGLATIYEISGTGLSTGREDIASHHARQGHPTNKLQVPCITLATIFESLNDKPIHWLKIDVEGMEREVLEGWGQHLARPWVLAIESTYPGTRRATEAEWLDLVTARGYREVWFDGLSRFFVADGHDDVAAAFDLPPNVFDGFAVTRDHLMASELRREDQLKHEQQEKTKAELTRLAEAAQSREHEVRLEFQRIVAEFSDAERRSSALYQQEQAHAAELQNDLNSLRAELAQRTDEFCSLQRATLAQEAFLAREIAAMRACIADLSEQLGAERAEKASLAAELRGAERLLAARAEQTETLLQAAEARERAQFEQIGQLVGQVASQTSGLEQERRKAEQLGQRLGALREGLVDSIHRMRLSILQMQAGLLGDYLELETVAITARSEHGHLDENASNLQDLLLLHDEAFICQAYTKLLGREVDPTGHSTYLGKLRAGYPKERIVAELARSPEGRQFGSMLPGLSKLLRQVPHRTSRWARKTDARFALSRSFENALGMEISSLSKLIDQD